MNFYRDLEPLELRIPEVFHPGNFFGVPSDWFIVISDVKNSTAAVQAGRHNDVNLVAAGSLIAGLNVARARNVEIPFFFGGDGGTLLVPEPLLNEVLARLDAHNVNSMRNFGLEMHVGSLPVREAAEAGHPIRIAKVRHGSGFNKPLVVGDGLRYAEQRIKGAGRGGAAASSEPAGLNLDGLECRWDKVKPPADGNEIVCYLIEGVDAGRQLDLYGEVLRKADEIYGPFEKRHPLSPQRLKLFLKFDKVKKEMMARYGRWKAGYFALSYLETLFSHLWFLYNWKVRNLHGRRYLSQLVSGADTLTIDGRITTIISGHSDMRLQFLEFLSAAEAAGQLMFGHHIDRESVMTCYIRNRDAQHIHFIDGSDGGYTEAARELKKKLASR